MAAKAPTNMSAPCLATSAPNSILLLIGRIGNLCIAAPVDAIERILPMVMLTPMPEMPQTIVGLLNLHGDALLVVNPRPLLGLPTPPYLPDQRLIVVKARSRFALWVDSVERILHTPFQDAPRHDGMSERNPAPYIVNLEGETVQVLALEVLDPGATGAYREEAEQP